MKLSELIAHAVDLISLYGDLEVHFHNNDGEIIECHEDILHFENDIQNFINLGYKIEDYNGPFPEKAYYIGYYGTDYFDEGE